MQLNIFFGTLAAVFGFLASICFCIGAISTGSAKIKQMSAGMVWGTNQALSDALASQSAQYAVGGLLLVVSFLLQVAAIAINQTNLITLHPMLANPALLALAALVPCSFVSFAGFYFVRKKLQLQLKDKE